MITIIIIIRSIKQTNIIVNLFSIMIYSGRPSRATWTLLG